MKTFPDGIDEAFHELIKTLSDKNEQDRYYYGISEIKKRQNDLYSNCRRKI